MARIQIIDDDYWCGEAIIAFMTPFVGHSSFETKSIPCADDGRDIYIVDNEFESGDHGISMIRSIRDRNPEAMIIMCTGTRSRIDPAVAMNAGCNAIIEKGSQAGREEMASIVQRYIETRAESATRRSVLAALRDIKAIITAWNRRMKQDAAINAPAAA